jgi:hypothetical protein
VDMHSIVDIAEPLSFVAKGDIQGHFDFLTSLRKTRESVIVSTKTLFMDCGLKDQNLSLSQSIDVSILANDILPAQYHTLSILNSIADSDTAASFSSSYSAQSPSPRSTSSVNTFPP